MRLRMKIETYEELKQRSRKQNTRKSLCAMDW